MKKETKTISVLAIVGTLLCSCATSINTTTPAVSDSEKQIAITLYEKINNHRKSYGLNPIRGHQALNSIAQTYSNNLSLGQPNRHTDENYEQYCYLKYNIENVKCYTYVSPSQCNTLYEDVMSMWSSVYLQYWEYVGIGIRKTEFDETYITLCIGARSSGLPKSIQPIGRLSKL